MPLICTSYSPILLRSTGQFSTSDTSDYPRICQNHLVLRVCIKAYYLLSKGFLVYFCRVYSNDEVLKMNRIPASTRHHRYISCFWISVAGSCSPDSGLRSPDFGHRRNNVQICRTDFLYRLTCVYIETLYIVHSVTI